MPATDPRRVWRYVRGLTAPVVLWALVLVTLWEPLQSWLYGKERYDEDALKEWIEETRLYKETLPEMVREDLDARDGEDERARRPEPDGEAARQELQAQRDKVHKDVRRQAEEIAVHLSALGTPTRIYASQLPLFPNIYRLQIGVAGQPE